MDEYFPVSDPLPPLPHRPQGEPAPRRGNRLLLPYAIVAGALAIAAGGYVAGHGTSATSASGPKVAAAVADLSAAGPTAAAPTPGGAPWRTDARRVAGTLKAVSGTSLTVDDASGKPIAVTTSPSTKISKTVAGILSDVTKGSVVALRGTSNGQNAISAEQISILPASAAQKLAQAGAGAGRLAQRAPAAGFAVGTVSQTANGGFTVTEPGGTAVTVTTSSSTKVVKTVDAAVTNLTVGQPIVVLGTANADGSIAAAQIAQGTGGFGPGGFGPGGFGPGGFGPGGFGPGGFGHAGAAGARATVN